MLETLLEGCQVMGVIILAYLIVLITVIVIDKKDGNEG
jgi:hypothetical protein